MRMIISFIAYSGVSNIIMSVYALHIMQRNIKGYLQTIKNNFLMNIDMSDLI